MFHADNRMQPEKSARDMWNDWHPSNYFSVVRPFWMEKGKRQQVGRHPLQEGYVGKSRQRLQEKVPMLPQLLRAIVHCWSIELHVVVLVTDYHITCCRSRNGVRNQTAIPLQKSPQLFIPHCLAKASEKKRESRGREEDES